MCDSDFLVLFVRHCPFRMFWKETFFRLWADIKKGTFSMQWRKHAHSFLQRWYERSGIDTAVSQNRRIAELPACGYFGLLLFPSASWPPPIAIDWPLANMLWADEQPRKSTTCRSRKWAVAAVAAVAVAGVSSARNMDGARVVWSFTASPLPPTIPNAAQFLIDTSYLTSEPQGNNNDTYQKTRLSRGKRQVRKHKGRVLPASVSNVTTLISRLLSTRLSEWAYLEGHSVAHPSLISSIILISKWAQSETIFKNKNENKWRLKQYTDVVHCCSILWGVWLLLVIWGKHGQDQGLGGQGHCLHDIWRQRHRWRQRWLPETASRQSVRYGWAWADIRGGANIRNSSQL